MAWSFQFQGNREDAIAAANNITVNVGAGHVDQLNRAKPLIISELQAMPPGTVVARCSGDYSSLNLKSRIDIDVQSTAVINNVQISKS